MYLPNAQYIPSPFKQSLKPAVKPTTTPKASPTSKTLKTSKEETPPISQNASPKPDIVAAEAARKHEPNNDGMETALLMLLLMDGIH